MAAKRPGQPTSEDSESLERWLATAKRGLLGVLFVMSNDEYERPWLAWSIVLFHMLQVCCVLLGGGGVPPVAARHDGRLW